MIIYDDAIRACAVSTVTADRTGKLVLLTRSLTASHCSAEAHLSGVPFLHSVDSCLSLKQSRSTCLKTTATPWLRHCCTDGPSDHNIVIAHLKV